MMKRSIKRATPAMIVAAAVMIIALISATAARAQITVINKTGCTIGLSLIDANNVMLSFLIPGGGGPTVIGTPPGYLPIKVQAPNAVWFPIRWPAPPVNPPHALPTPPPPNGSGCTGCMRLQAPGIVPPFCCGDVCYDVPSNTITIWPCVGC